MEKHACCYTIFYIFLKISKINFRIPPQLGALMQGGEARLVVIKYSDCGNLSSCDDHSGAGIIHHD